MNGSNINRQNGRVNLSHPSTNTQFSMYDQIPVNQPCGAYNALSGIWNKTELSERFFSPDNMNVLQQGIINGVANKSGGKFKIGRQNNDTLMIIMRSIFLQNSKNQPSNIQQQINDLNKLVLDYSVPQVYTQVLQYVNYRKDISTMPVPINKPFSTREEKVLEHKSWF